MTRKRRTRIVQRLLLLVACLLFGLFFRAGVRLFTTESFDGDWQTASLHDYDAGYFRGLLTDHGLYMPSSHFLAYEPRLATLGDLAYFEATLSLGPGGFARLYFGDRESTYDSFCISLDATLPTGFYRHQVGTGSTPISPAAKWTPKPQETEWDDERYSALFNRRWDLMPVEWARQTDLRQFKVRIERRTELLIALIDGVEVAQTDRPDQFRVENLVSVGVASGRFPGCFVDALALAPKATGLVHATTFERPLSRLGGWVKGILFGSLIAWVYWSLATGLLRRWVMKNPHHVGVLQGMLLAIIGLPILAARGPESAPLVIGFCTVLFVAMQSLLIVACGGLRSLSYPNPVLRRHAWEAAVIGVLALVGGIVATGILPSAEETRQNIDATVALEPNSVAEIYFRMEISEAKRERFYLTAPPQWYAFRLSTDPKEGCRFVSSMGPVREVANAPVLNADKKYQVHLELRDDTFVAMIDGAPVDRFSDPVLVSGRTGSVVRHGAASVDGLKITSLGSKSLGLAYGLKLTVPLLLAALLLYAILRGPVGRLAFLGPGFLWPMGVAGLAAILWRDEAPEVMIVGAAVSVWLLWIGATQNAKRSVVVIVLWIPLGMVMLFYMEWLAAGPRRLAPRYSRPVGYLSQTLFANGGWTPSQGWIYYTKEYPFQNKPDRVPVEKPAGVVRVLTLGGSSTWGQGCDNENSYPSILEKILNDGAPTPRYEVLNAGLRGMVSTMGLELLENHLLKYTPDVVVFNFGFNDALPTWTSYRETLAAQKETDLVPPRPMQRAMISWLENAAKSTQLVSVPDKQIVPPEEFKQTTERLLALAEQYHFAVLFVSEPYEWHEQYASWSVRQVGVAQMRQLAARSDTDRIDYLPALERFRTGALDDLMNDRVHHSRHGNRVMAEWIAEKLPLLEKKE